MWLVWLLLAAGHSVVEWGDYHYLFSWKRPDAIPPSLQRSLMVSKVGE
jgi:hypothetical protein